MARFGVGALRFRGGALFVLGLGVLAACHGSQTEDARAAEREDEPTLPCGEDETREVFCDDLLPLTSSRPAPEPYDNCPATTEARHSAYPPVGHIANFDTGFTAYTRQRVAARGTLEKSAASADLPSGHSCCYSWCAKVEVAEPAKAIPGTCRDAYGLAQTFCMREVEGATSEPSASPFEHCPVAVKPPESVAFAAPVSALLDVNETSQRRRDLLLADCCYSWCSRIPAGTVLKPAAHPKIK